MGNANSQASGEGHLVGHRASFSRWVVLIMMTEQPCFKGSNPALLRVSALPARLRIVRRTRKKQPQQSVDDVDLLPRVLGRMEKSRRSALKLLSALGYSKPKRAEMGEQPFTEPALGMARLPHGR